MKLTIARSAFLSALAPAQTITSSTSPLPFGSCVLLRASPESLTVQATSAVNSVRATAFADVTAQGALIVPAAELVARVSAMPDGPMVVSVKNDKLMCTAGPRVYTLRTLPAENFPTFHKAPDAMTQLPSKAVLDALDRVRYAQDDEKMGRPQLWGVLLASYGDKINATACDMKRVARASVPTHMPCATFSTFIPSKAVEVLVAALSHADGEISVAATEIFVYAKIGAVEITYQLVAATPPPYDLFLSGLKATDGPRVERRALIECVKSVTPDGTSGVTPVVIRHRSGVLSFEHTTTAGEVSTDEVPTDSNAHPFSVSVEAKYMKDALRAMRSEHVRICVSPDLEQPVVLRDGDVGIATVARIADAPSSVEQKEAA